MALKNSPNIETGSEDGDDLPTLIDRTPEYDGLVGGLENEQFLYLYGPKGTGKTLLTRHALADTANVCYLSCINQNTQYKVLTTLYSALFGDEPSTGYHTAQLSNAITVELSDQDLLLVLDDIDFLLLNDGSDLLYFLSRLDQQCTLQLVMISANYPELSTQIDERIYSTLLPCTVYLEPYAEDETLQILDARVDDWLNQPVSADALSFIATTASNIELSRHWLTTASDIVDGTITADIIRLVQSDTRQRYRTALLAPFSIHHHLLLDAIDLLTADTEPVRSGAIYDLYRELCAQSTTESLSTRRLSHYLKQLDLLDLIRTEYKYGGETGKTRHIWLQEV